MPNQVVVLHGWSDTSDSFKPLISFLKSSGYSPVPLWLGDYLSLDDDVAIDDVVGRMQQVLQERLGKGDLEAPFDLIVHSTGGLVARRWLTMYYPDGSKCPLKRLLMLAPANHGSPLAHLGQSMLGRVLKGFNNWFQTGTRMLKALELASPFQWDLARLDLFTDEDNADTPKISPYGPRKIWPFVIVGSHPYTSALRQIVNENGGDGTVRVAAANLNARGITIDFSNDENAPEYRHWPLRHQEWAEESESGAPFPLAVLPDQSHGSIVDPNKQEIRYTPPEGQRLNELVLEALGCNTEPQYRKIAERWRNISEDTAKLTDAQVRQTRNIEDEKAECFHQYMQVVVKVVDSYGQDVTDYFIEFFGPGKRKDDAAVFFHREVLEDVHVNSANAAMRCLFVDRTDLLKEFYKRLPGGQKKILLMSVSATPLGSNVRFFSKTAEGAPAEIPVHAEDDADPNSRWFKRNTTHYVKLIIPRIAAPEVFRLKHG